MGLPLCALSKSRREKTVSDRNTLTKLLGLPINWVSAVGMLGKSAGDVFVIVLVAIGMFLNLALSVVLLRLNLGPLPPPPPTERRLIIYVASVTSVNVF